MADRKTAPPPADYSDPDVAHKSLVALLADHPDPQVRVLAHISSRQFELSERVTDLQLAIQEGFAALKKSLSEMRTELGDKIDRLDGDFVVIDDRVDDLMKEVYSNGDSSPTEQ